MSGDRRGRGRPAREPEAVGRDAYRAWAYVQARVVAVWNLDAAVADAVRALGMSRPTVFRRLHEAEMVGMLLALCNGEDLAAVAEDAAEGRFRPGR